MARVLLVDDEACFRETTGLRLELGGHEVVAVADAGAALAEAAREHFDVAVLDLALPGVGGLDLLRLLRAGDATRELPVVCYTAQPGAQVAAEALALADAYLAKGQPMGQLLATVNELTRTS
jgi:two-component system response regulator PhoP